MVLLSEVPSPFPGREERKAPKMENRYPHIFVLVVFYYAWRLRYLGSTMRDCSPPPGFSNGNYNIDSQQYIILYGSPQGNFKVVFLSHTGPQAGYLSVRVGVWWARPATHPPAHLSPCRRRNL